MAMTYALLYEENGSFGISFPDFPGCISGGGSAEEALRRGRGALAFHIAGMVEDGDAMPRLRGLDELRADRDFRADCHACRGRSAGQSLASQHLA